MVLRKAAAASQKELDTRHEHAKMEMHELHEHARPQLHGHVDDLHGHGGVEGHVATQAEPVETHEKQPLEYDWLSVGREVSLVGF
jgi:hypothetical protein